MQIELFSITDRPYAVARDTYAADLEEIVLADQLGYDEAWIGEHLYNPHAKPGQMPAPELFICKAAALTNRIRMGPGVRQLPFHHPIEVASEAAVCDHLTLPSLGRSPPAQLVG